MSNEYCVDFILTAETTEGKPHNDSAATVC